MSPRRNRTSEFHATVTSFRTPTSPPNAPWKPGQGQQALQARGEFGKRASAIAHNIQQTTTRLAQLATLARRTNTPFDDRPGEIPALTQVIKQDIARINRSIADLQNLTRSGPNASGLGNHGQSREHANNVVLSLQSKLADTSMGFKDVLETRTKVGDRREQFAHPMESTNFMNGSPLLRPADSRGGPSAPNTPPPPGNSALTIDMGEDDNSGPNQALLYDSQDTSYLESRSSAIEGIESTVAELGQIFQQLAHMVAEQANTVQRIDANVEEISTNVSGAQRELLKYWRNMSSNRWLMLKIFAVVLFFFMLFVLVL
ncbi:syntaxin 5 [Piptocephalis cylindrospora]|uniref:Syntaxin 5 n=1 Tax=Piptocephalis cylindrospora TaxID=1907219 RepID=A0A4P9Y171_9FUNG|nr:syntaxin 5 [Piptocephalis cylindrospora]|eukprot:RKP12503.1 syntaxin 5 [Piptocephalis cylindrospora]